MDIVRRPVLAYYGSKWRLAPKIISLMPPHKRYVEVFGGSAAVLLRKQKVPHEVYNDNYGEVVNFFRCLRDYPDELIRVLTLTPYSRKEWEASKNDDKCTDTITRARRFYILSWQSWRSEPREGKDTYSSWKRWSNGRTNCNFPPICEDLYAVADRLSHILIDDQDFEEIINYYDSSDTVFYVDPPYLGHNYATQKGTEEFHLRLAESLVMCEGYVVLSASESTLYDDIYGSMGWKKISMSSRNVRGNKTTEVLWMNYS